MDRMNRATIALAALLLFASPLRAADDGDEAKDPMNRNAGKFAILMGIHHYGYTNKFANLKNSHKDMMDLRETLVNVLQYRAENVHLLVDDSDLPDYVPPTMEAFDSKVTQIVKDFKGCAAPKGDKSLIIAFSGHGYSKVVDGTRENFFVPQYSGEFSDEKCIKLNRLFTRLNDDFDGGNKILFVDACRSEPPSATPVKGETEKNTNDYKSTSFDRRTFENKGVDLLFSCDETESSYEDVANGFFTSYLIKGIKYYNDKKGGQNGIITTKDLYEFMLNPKTTDMSLSAAVKKTIKGGKQTPVYYQHASSKGPQQLARYKSSEDFLAEADQDALSLIQAVQGEADINEIVRLEGKVEDSLKSVETENYDKDQQERDWVQLAQVHFLKAVTAQTKYEKLIVNYQPQKRVDALRKIISEWREAIRACFEDGTVTTKKIERDAYYFEALNRVRLAELEQEDVKVAKEEIDRPVTIDHLKRSLKTDDRLKESLKTDDRLKRSLKTDAGSYQQRARLLLAELLYKESESDQAKKLLDEPAKLLNEAKNRLEQWIRQDAGSDKKMWPKAHLLLGQIELAAFANAKGSGDPNLKQQIFESARKVFQKVIDSRDVDPIDKAEAFFQHGKARYASVEFEKDSDQSRVLQGAADDFVHAIQLFKNAPEESERRAKAWEYLCQSRGLLVKRLSHPPVDEVKLQSAVSQGVEDCKKALKEAELDSKAKGALNLLWGDMLLMGGESDKAMHCYEEAKGFFGDDDVLNQCKVLWGKACCDYELGNAEVALKQCEEVVARLEKLAGSDPNPEGTDLLTQARKDREDWRKELNASGGNAPAK